MRHFPWLVLAVCLACATPGFAKDPTADSIVKIYSTRRQPDLSRPWAKVNSQEGSGSGVILEGKRILTNAHVVLYASTLLVQANQSSERVPAKVVAVAPAVDLALVEVESPEFFEGRVAIPLAEEIPAIKQPVNVYGYPMGGEQLSVTQGVVSRIEYGDLYYLAMGLRIQIDAALNPGNSGGPAIVDGKLLGLVFSKLSPKTEAESIGYLIAAEEIAMFLKDVEDGKYDGKPVLPDVVHPTENEALRAKLGLHEEEGVMVSQPFRSAPDYPLKRWDVILRIGEEPIDRLGNVKVKDDLKLAFRYLVAKLAKDGSLKLTILRNGQQMEVQVPVSNNLNLVVPFLGGSYPRYFIHGPLVFTAATQELVWQLAGKAGVQLMFAQNPLLMRDMDYRAFDGEELVVLAVLPHTTSKGYTPPPYSVVTHVNGTSVRNLAHLVELLRDAKEEFLTIDLAGRAAPLVFRREEAIQATEDILSTEGIRRQCSEDLESAWQPAK